MPNHLNRTLEYFRIDTRGQINEQLTVTNGHSTHFNAFCVWVTALWRDNCRALCASKLHSVHGNVSLVEPEPDAFFTYDIVTRYLPIDRSVWD